jgi:hypothetical protein
MNPNPAFSLTQTKLKGCSHGRFFRVFICFYMQHHQVPMLLSKFVTKYVTAWIRLTGGSNGKIDSQRLPFVVDTEKHPTPEVASALRIRQPAKR